MNIVEKKQNRSNVSTDPGQKGTAIVIALLILALLSVFVAFAVSRTTAETMAVGNETSEARTFYAAQGALETMTRNFNKVFETKLNPLQSDIDQVQDGTKIPGISQEQGGQYNIQPDRVVQTSTTGAVVLPTGPYAGLYAIRENWRLRVTATDIRDSTQVQLTRNVLNNRIPIFQFGIFYNDDLELFRPPRFSFGGRVHSNGNFFISPGAEGIYFDSRVTATGHIVTQSWRNWNTSDSANDDTFIKNASGTFIRLLPTKGSVLNTTLNSADNVFQFPPPAPTPVPTPNADLPPSRLNSTWDTDSSVFDGNLRARVAALRLPLNVGQGTDLVEMVKRGKEVANINGGDLFMNNAGVIAPVTAAANEVDNPILRSERFANKTGIRVSLADSKAKLPGCANGTGTTPIATPCGIRLDGDVFGQGADPNPADAVVANRARGYQPKNMRLNAADAAFGYRSTRVNGERLFHPTPVAVNRGVWIKVETVQTNATTGAIMTTDITEDILSLGMTEQAPVIAGLSIDGYDSTHPDNRSDLITRNINQTTPQTASTGNDSRSVIKIQRFAIAGPNIPGPAPNLPEVAPATKWLYPFGGYNFVSRFRGTVAAIDAGCTAGCTSRVNDDPNFPTTPNTASENRAHFKKMNYGDPLGLRAAIVPFPIEMFDTREGTYFDNIANTPAAPNVSRNGVMSMIDIDIANLRRFLRGDYNGLFPDGAAAIANSTPFSRNNTGNTGLRACTFQNPAPTPCDIPENGGWVLYISDRRGDVNFDGEYDMEDVYGNNDGVTQPGEDLDGPVGPNQRFGAGVLDRIFDVANCAPTPVLSAAGCEASRYADTYTADRAAVTDHPYFRRGVRLINGTVIPGIYDSAVAANVKGFTVSSENGIYVQGNYNATGAATPVGNANTPYNQFFPFDTATHVPASIVADAVTILSNAWNDAESFSSPYNQGNRDATTTQMRFAMIAGDTISTKQNATNQGSSVNGQNENGGVHNFKRFLEQWDSAGGIRLDYAGSLINLFNSRNNNGSFKCCNTVYNPPRRNWVFDSTFLDPARIPPGTPFFQYVQTTGFERTNALVNP